MFGSGIRNGSKVMAYGYIRSRILSTGNLDVYIKTEEGTELSRSGHEMLGQTP